MDLNPLRSVGRRLARGVLPLVLAAAFLAVPGTLSAAGTTGLHGAVRGLEICPQIFCGAAVFIGEFDGSLDDAAIEGSWWVVVRHEELPLVSGGSTPITGGSWSMIADGHTLRGAISTGTIVNNGDGTFTVTPRLEIARGGAGTLSLSILLDHRSFPPTVAGSVAANVAATQPQS